MTNAIIYHETAQGFQSISLDDHYFSERILFLTEEVNVQSCSELIKRFKYLDQLSHKEITLFINSPGGEVTSGLCLYEVIRQAKSPVTCICIGMAGSMGSILYLAGDKRLMYPDSQIMIHDPAAYFGESYANYGSVKDQLDSLMKIRQRIAGIIAKRTGQKLETILEYTSKDSFFSAKEALELGLAHQIITSTQKGECNYEQ